MARERIAPDGQVVDDDGQTIAPGDFGHLEVAHILPHSFLVKIESKSEQLVCFLYPLIINLLC